MKNICKCRVPGCNKEIVIPEKGRIPVRCPEHLKLGVNFILYRHIQKEELLKKDYVESVEIVYDEFSYKRAIDLEIKFKHLDCLVRMSTLAACHIKGGGRRRKKEIVDEVTQLKRKYRKEKMGGTEYTDIIGLKATILEGVIDDEDLIQVDKLIEHQSADVIFAPSIINFIEKHQDNREDVVKKLKNHMGGELTPYFEKWINFLDDRGFFHA